MYKSTVVKQTIIYNKYEYNKERCPIDKFTSYIYYGYIFKLVLQVINNVAFILFRNRYNNIFLLLFILFTESIAIARTLQN